MFSCRMKLENWEHNQSSQKKSRDEGAYYVVVFEVRILRLNSSVLAMMKKNKVLGFGVANDSSEEVSSGQQGTRQTEFELITW